MNAQARPSPLNSADLWPAAKSSGEIDYGRWPGEEITAAPQNVRKIRV